MFVCVYVFQNNFNVCKMAIQIDMQDIRNSFVLHASSNIFIIICSPENHPGKCRSLSSSSFKIQTTSFSEFYVFHPEVLVK